MKAAPQLAIPGGSPAWSIRQAARDVAYPAHSFPPSPSLPSRADNPGQIRPAPPPDHDHHHFALKVVVIKGIKRPKIPPDCVQSENDQVFAVVGEVCEDVG
jgi:hypothetical protein